MLYKFWQWLQLWLPFGLVLHMYRMNPALPANISLRNGRKLKAIMITTDYGILFSDEIYIQNRLQLLKKQQQQAFELNNKLVHEINSLSLEQREQMYNRDTQDGI